MNICCFDDYTRDRGRDCHWSAAKTNKHDFCHLLSLAPGGTDTTASTCYGSAKEIYKVVNHDQAYELCLSFPVASFE